MMKFARRIGLVMLAAMAAHTLARAGDATPPASATGTPLQVTYYFLPG